MNVQTIEKDLSIHKTFDYGLFKFFEYNRETDDNHIAALEASFLQGDDTHLNPILVTSDYFIINGQHRYMACLNLNKPIYYIIDHNYTKNKLLVHNTLHKSWRADDVINYYKELGYIEYIKLYDLLKKYKFKVTTFRELACNSEPKRFYQQLRDGVYKLSLEQDEIKTIDAYVAFRELIVSQGFSRKSMLEASSFLRAFCRFFSCEAICFERFIDRYQVRGQIYQFFSSSSLHLSQMANIYNFDMRTKDKVIIITNPRGHSKVELYRKES
jgi:hypothetical protein